MEHEAQRSTSAIDEAVTAVCRTATYLSDEDAVRVPGIEFRRLENARSEQRSSEAQVERCGDRFGRAVCDRPKGHGGDVHTGPVGNYEEYHSWPCRTEATPVSQNRETMAVLVAKGWINEGKGRWHHPDFDDDCIHSFDVAWAEQDNVAPCRNDAQCRHFQVETMRVCTGGEGPDDAQDFVRCVACGAEGFRYVTGTMNLAPRSLDAQPNAEGLPCALGPLLEGEMPVFRMLQARLSLYDARPNTLRILAHDIAKLFHDPRRPDAPPHNTYEHGFKAALVSMRDRVQERAKGVARHRERIVYDGVLGILQGLAYRAGLTYPQAPPAFSVGDRVKHINPDAGSGEGAITAITYRYDVHWDGEREACDGYRDVELEQRSAAATVAAKEVSGVASSKPTGGEHDCG
jgi:hypothetical protein